MRVFSASKGIQNLWSKADVDKPHQKKIKDMMEKRRKIDANKARLKYQLKKAREQQQARLRRYEQLNLRGKIEYAENGYRFGDEEPAIELCQTIFNAPENMGRGIRVGKSLGKLPIGFMILYSHYEKTAELATDIQRFYQVAIPGNLYMRCHNNQVAAYGLANFINSALRRKDDVSLALRANAVTQQNMKKSQCDLVWSTSGFDDQLKDTYPAYVKVVKPIPQGHEVLMRYGAKYRLGSVDNQETSDARIE